ncbi:hypothetical protein D6777_03325 [Candidatus Woesearchaeota archaeon]|nr:MAG: hypothetical protein D6777_03325 [Candidatus Woesearchaeota archaeon]
MMKTKRIVSMFMVLLIVMMPLAFAAETANLKKGAESVQTAAKDVASSSKELAKDVAKLEFDKPSTKKFNEQDTGESIVVNAVGYEPSTLKSSLLEDDDVPVYVFLAGSTLGNLLGSSGRNEPLYSLPEIKHVIMKPLDVGTKNLLRGSPRYIKPKQYSLDNLGFLAMQVKKIEKEKNIPDEINLSMQAEIYFEGADRTYSMFQQDLYLPEDGVEAEWRQKDLTPYSFFAKRGFLRASKIENNKVTLVYYSGSDLLPPYTGTPRPIRQITLAKGQTSDYYTIRESSDLLQNTFRIKVLDIVDPYAKRVKVRLNVNGEQTEKILTEGSRLYPGSSYVVKKISYVEDQKTGKVRVDVSLVSSSSVEVASKTYYKQKQISEVKQNEDPCAKKAQVLERLMNPGDRVIESDVNLFDTPKKIIEGQAVNLENGQILSNKEAQSQLAPGFYLKYQNDSFVFYTLKTNGKLDDATPDSVFEVGDVSYEREKKVYFLTVSGKTEKPKSLILDVIIRNIKDTSSLNSEQRNAENFVDNLKNIDQESVLCTAVQEYKKLFSGCDDVADSDGVALGAKAAFKIAEAYDWLGYPQMALEYYKKSLKDSKGSHIFLAQNKINELQTAIEQGASYNTVTLNDLGRNVEVKVLGLLNLDPELAAKATIDVQGEGTKEIKQGTEVFGEPIVSTSAGKTYVRNWVLERVEPNYAVLRKVEVVLQDDKSKSEPVTKLKESGLTSIYKKAISYGSKAFSWVSNVGRNVYNSLANFLNRNRLPSSTSTSKTISLNTPVTLEGKTLFLRKTESKRAAIVTIIPGTGKPLKSVSNFTIHIPIEKRAIQFTPEQLLNKINNTQKTIDSLTDVIDSFDNVLKLWKQVCIFTFLFLTVKNSFLSGTERNIARSLAMKGNDGNSGWNKYCKVNSGKNRLYSSFDECISENADNINRQIDEMQEAVERVNEEMENYKEQEWYKELMSKYNGYDKYGKLLGKDLYSPKTLRDYRLWSLLKDSRSYNELYGQTVDKGAAYNFQKEVDEALKSYKFDKSAESFNNAVELINKKYPDFDSKTPEEQRQIFQDLVTTGKVAEEKVASNSFLYLRIMNVKSLSTVRKKGTKIVSYSPYGEIELVPATVTDYIDKLESIISSQSDESVKKELQKHLDQIKKQYSKSLLTPLSSKQGLIYVEAKDGKAVPNGQFYVFKGSVQVLDKVRKTYDPLAVVEYYPDGKPYCVPTSNGNFVKILDFFNDGSPKTIQEWNVGPDGRLCTGDDILIKHNSVLMSPKENTNYRKLLVQANKFTKKKKGEIITVGGKKWQVSTNAASVNKQNKNPTCYDVMDPDDCQTLFGVCDPVLCPPSRFNLNGNWQVDNVVQTGILGSLFLGLHNFQLPKEPVPVCLTGISAGLKNIRSILEGYVQCLKVSYVQGKTVGICDKIRSVYTCEVIWKEALALFKVKGGIVKWLFDKLSGNSNNGGGEYLGFQSALKNAENSANFFFKQYSTSAFAAFNARSTEEIGTTICKKAIYGKLPNVGKLMDQLSTPEDPPQYTALLSVSPYSETTGLDQYQVYYHIYAGKTARAPVTRSQGFFGQGGIVNSASGSQKGVDYSVFLKNDLGQTFYVTESCRNRRSFIKLGGLADYTVDCVAPKGFNQVCITINGDTKCGFGKVTSLFALNYINDLIVEDEAKRNIDSEEECAPTSYSGSASMLGLGVATKVGAVSPYVLGGVSTALDYGKTGIKRYCSVDNPGRGTNPQDYKIVGTCGKDSFGNNLGACWIDLRTVSINHLERMESVKKQLDEKTLKRVKELAGVKDTLDSRQSEERLKQVQTLPLEDCKQMYVALANYKLLVDKSLDGEVACKAKYGMATVLDKLARDKRCVKFNPKHTGAKILLQFENQLIGLSAEFDNEKTKILAAKASDQLEKAKLLAFDYAKKMNEAKKLYEEQLTQLEKKEKQDYSTEKKQLQSILEKYLSNVGITNVEVITKSNKTTGQIKKKIEKCNSCKGGLICTEDNCHSISGCYVAKESGFNKCLSCVAANSCFDFKDDKEMCEANRKCAEERGFECKYLAGGCWPASTTVKKSLTNVCNKCGKDDLVSRAFGLKSCDADKCNKLDKDCFFTISNGKSSCFACNAATKCEDFKFDKKSCEQGCSLTNLKCEWKGNTCVAKTTKGSKKTQDGKSTASIPTGACIKDLDEYYKQFPAAKFLQDKGFYISPEPIKVGSDKTVPFDDKLSFLPLNKKDRQSFVDMSLPNFVPTSNPTFTSNGGKSDGKHYDFEVTNYYIADCKYYKNRDGTINWDKFAKAVKIEGSGYCETDGKKYCYHLNLNNKFECSEPLARTATGTYGRPFKTIAVNSAAFTSQSSAAKIEAFYNKVNPKLFQARGKDLPVTKCRIPYGSYVYMKFKSDKWKKFSGWRIAQDTGGHSYVQRCWIDLYVGTKDNNIGVTRNVDIWVYPVLKGPLPLCSGSKPQSPTVNQKTNLNGKSCNNWRIAAVGDSLTAAKGHTQWPDYLKQKLQQICPGIQVDKIGAIGYYVENPGTSKDITGEFERNNVPENYDIVIIMGGMNDVSSNFRKPIQIINDLESLYKKVKEKNKVLVAMTITPWKDHTSWTETKQAYTNSVNQWIVGSGYPDFKVDTFSLLDINNDLKLDDDVSGCTNGCDHMHFNSAGHKKIADALMNEVITPILGESIVNNLANDFRFGGADES